MATAAAAVVARARINVLSHFMRSNAVSAAQAVKWVPERRLEQRILRRLVERGVLVETAPETYYLDVPVYDRWKSSRRRRAAILISAVAIIGAAAAALA